MQNKGESFFFNKKILKIIYKWRLPLLIIALITIILTAIISSPLVTSPVYEASVILYPSSTNSISKALLTETSMPNQDILHFGEDGQTEQMLQILNSSTLKEKVIHNFDLAKHYKIHENQKYFYTKLYNKLKKNIKIKRTVYSAVQITVFDKDPQMCADIANNIAAVVDTIRNEMQRERAVQGFKIVEESYLSLSEEINKLNDSLTLLMNKGVNDYETQAEMMNQQMAKEIASGNSRAVKALKSELDTLAKYGGAYVSLRDALKFKLEQLSVIRIRYEEAKVDATQSMTYNFIVEKAYKPERKSFPKMGLNIFISLITVMFFSLLIISILENLGKDFSFTDKKTKI